MPASRKQNYETILLQSASGFCSKKVLTSSNKHHDYGGGGLRRRESDCVHPKLYAKEDSRHVHFMPKRVFIIHGWGGNPQEGWFPWLKKELQMRGFVVQVPSMPNPEEPKIETWVPFLSKLVGQADENTFLVGHSIGCQTIIRYLQTLPEGVKIGGAVFVAGWYNLRNLETDDEKRIAGPWVNEPRDDKKIRQAVNRAIAIFSDNDPFVIPENQKSWGKLIGAKIIVEHQKGHFSGDDGIKELPSALEALLEIAGEKQ